VRAVVSGVGRAQELGLPSILESSEHKITEYYYIDVKNITLK
jgi:hypothetical protein